MVDVDRETAAHVFIGALLVSVVAVFGHSTFVDVLDASGFGAGASPAVAGIALFAALLTLYAGKKVVFK